MPIRHGRMLASPFAFFRGAAAIMAADLAATPVSGLDAQLCGDAHLANFGAFAAPDRHLVFDVNDFDETLAGPWEWDVKRLAASCAVLGRDQGFAAAERGATITRAVAEYRDAMRSFATMRTIEVWYARLEVEQQYARLSSLVSGSRLKKLDETLAKGTQKDSLRAFAKLTHDVDGVPRIVSDPPRVVPIDELPAERGRLSREQLEGLYREYRTTLADDKRHLLDGYRPVDLAHKVVGIGSVGLEAWIMLLLGNGPGDPLFLQIKEAGRSVLEPFARASRFANSGERVVEGQRLIQASSDVFLGWLRFKDASRGRQRDYYVRQLWDAKVTVPLERLRASELAVYAGVCGWTLARAHARTGDRAAIAAYLGGGDTFDRALVKFAEAYARQNERDYKEFARAVRAGKLTAETGI